MYTISTGLFKFGHKALGMLNLSNLMYRSDIPIHEITENVYLGDFRAADDMTYLKHHGITHIINCAEGIPEVYPESFKYLSLELKDIESQDLTEAITISLDFIKDGGRVFIHCKMGVSRSASIVIAYLMKERGMSYNEALSFVATKRACVVPNRGFEAQLRKLEEEWRIE
jgi:protein-tyrosine phosphatase